VGLRATAGGWSGKGTKANAQGCVKESSGNNVSKERERGSRVSGRLLRGVCVTTGRAGGPSDSGSATWE